MSSIDLALEQNYQKELNMRVNSRANSGVSTLAKKLGGDTAVISAASQKMAKQAFKTKGNPIKATKLAIKTASDIAKTIDVERDWPYFFVFLFSMLADLFTLIPIVGNFLAIPFTAGICLFYTLAGHFKVTKPGALAIRLFTIGGASGIEIIGVGINAMFFYSISAAVNYALVLLERYSNKKN